MPCKGRVFSSHMKASSQSVSDEPYGNVVSSSLSVLLSVSEPTWAPTDTCADLFAFFVLWNDDFVFDKKGHLFRAITVHAIERWHEE